jgi:hypothetical protein
VQCWISWSCQDIILTVNSKWYRIMVVTFLTLEYHQQELHGVCFQDRTMAHTVRNRIKVLHNLFHDWTISCFGTLPQLASIPDFTWSYLKKVLSTCIHSIQQLKPKSDRKLTPFAWCAALTRGWWALYTDSDMVS